jgi:transcriptional regulator GlxA family with amidase domain
MSLNSLHRQFQEEGASIKQFMDNARLERAKDLLLRTAKPIKQVAMPSGFQNKKSFARFFYIRQEHHKAIFDASIREHTG